MLLVKGKKSVRKSKRERNAMTSNKINQGVWPKYTRSKWTCVGPPDSLECFLKYVEQGIQYTGAASESNVWRSNSCFDPNLTGVGHQPHFYDQLSAIYNQYCVIGCEAQIEISNQSSTVSVFATAGHSDINPTGFSAETVNEQKFYKSVTLGVNTGISERTIKLPYISIKTVQGQKQLESDPNNYQAITANPADVVYLGLFLSSTDGVTSMNVYTKTTIIYHVIMKELNVASESFLKKLEPQRPIEESEEEKRLKKEFEEFKLVKTFTELNFPKENNNKK